MAVIRTKITTADLRHLNPDWSMRTAQMYLQTCREALGKDKKRNFVTIKDWCEFNDLPEELVKDELGVIY